MLLWASTSNTGSPIRKIRHSSSSAIASPRMVTFPVSPAPQYTRRVSSLYSSSVMSSTEMSPKLRSSKSYSKWEKQEIEAEAIARLRRKAEEKEKARAEAEAKEAEAKSDEKPSVVPQIAASPFSLPLPPKADTQVTDPTRPPSLFTLSSNTQPGETKGKPETKTTQSFPSFSFPSAPVPTPQTSAPTPAASGPSTIPNPFAQNAPPATTPSLAAKGTTTPFFGFGQTKPPESNPTNVSSTSQGNGPAPPNLFSFPTSATSTTARSDMSANAPSTGETGDASKPKFKFQITNKPPAPPPSNPSLAAATSSDPPKPTFNFGAPKSSSAASTMQPTANLFSNAGATTTQVNQPSVFGTTGDSKPAGFSSMSVASGIKVGESTSLATPGQPLPLPTEAATGESIVVFGRSAKAQDANTKPSPFATNGSLFSFNPAPDNRSGTNSEPGKTAPGPFMFTPTKPAPPTPVVCSVIRPQRVLRTWNRYRSQPLVHQKTRLLGQEVAVHLHSAKAHSARARLRSRLDRRNRSREVRVTCTVAVFVWLHIDGSKNDIQRLLIYVIMVEVVFEMCLPLVMGHFHVIRPCCTSTTSITSLSRPIS
ncbi:hypothetical protein BGW80DRAFT_773086 [Lactifluus volemus]|nr:hypothetical protein BGW80DRAFT_773086 [Lactifluus volemus]